MARWNRWLGFAFLFFGTIFLLDNVGLFSLNWSLYIILAGGMLLLVYFTNRDLWFFLLPGIILFFYGILFFYCQVFGWQNMNRLWPVLFLIPGIAFGALYFLQNRKTQFLVPTLLFLIFGILFFFRKYAYVKLWPILLVLSGFYFLIKFYRTKNHGSGD